MSVKVHQAAQAGSDWRANQVSTVPCGSHIAQFTGHVTQNGMTGFVFGNQQTPLLFGVTLTEFIQRFFTFFRAPPDSFVHGCVIGTTGYRLQITSDPIKLPRIAAKPTSDSDNRIYIAAMETSNAINQVDIAALQTSNAAFYASIIALQTRFTAKRLYIAAL
jgi:hypothetical protein